MCCFFVFLNVFKNVKYAMCAMPCSGQKLNKILNVFMNSGKIVYFANLPQSEINVIGQKVVNKNYNYVRLLINKL